MLGEHGNQQFAPWSCVSFCGMPLDVWAETDERFRFDREALQKKSIGGGWVTFSGKQCTEYGIATTAARMAYIVLHDEKAIMPASAELCGEYGVLIIITSLEIKFIIPIIDKTFNNI